MAILRRGVSGSAAVDQIDLANNHFHAGILQQSDPRGYALEDGDLTGFDAAVEKVNEHGFVCVEGLLDDEIASVIYDECTQKYWDNRQIGAMHPSTAGGGCYECWLPYPTRRGTSPELTHALRVMFGLSNELVQYGYPVKLKVPSMAQLCVFPPRDSCERLHLDNNLGPGSTSGGDRELSIVLFCNPSWEEDEGGAFRAHFDAEEDRPCAERPSSSVQGTVQADASGAESDGAAVVPEGMVAAAAASAEASPEAEVVAPESSTSSRPKDFEPQAGRCLIFRSRELWHEMLPPSRRHQIALTLFVQSAE